MGYLIRYFCLFGLLISLGACGSEKTYQEGKQLYEKHCANCHMNDGKGFEALNPPLAGADILTASGAAAACWIRNGLSGPMLVNGQEFENEMPANKNLSAIEITNILNYIQNAWGNQHKFITLEEVEKVLKSCP